MEILELKYTKAKIKILNGQMKGRIKRKVVISKPENKTTETT
jgi:hypothetical protein